MAIDTLGAALRRIDRLLADGAVTGLSDAQLLERFVARRDPTAFEAIVARHGPMVLSVCRGTVHDPGDAEDAFQAVFLILVKKAGTIRGRVILGGWLYRVARRAASEANRTAARRRAHELRAGRMAAAASPPGATAADDLLPALHEEIARLPEKYRLPVVLCDLEGIPQAEAAGRLHWSERTLRRRLAEARDRLRSRLRRRGLGPEGAALSAAFLREAVPPAWGAAAVRAAIDTLNPAVAAGAVSAAARSLMQEVLRTMFVQNLTIAATALLCAGLMAWMATAAVIARRDDPPGAAPVAVARRTAPSPRPEPEPEPDPLDGAGTFPVRGLVVDPDGMPVVGAGIHVFHRADITEKADPRSRPGRVTATGADGRFRFDLDRAASD